MSGEAPIEFVVRLRGGAEAAADAKRVESAVGALGGSVRRVGTDSERTAKKTTAFGSSLKHVALGLGGVAAGFAAYSAAKNAISYTTELARSSEVLSKATGMSIGESSKLTAVSGALGVSNTKLSQVFTKVGAATVKQAEATGKHITAFDRLGISQDFARKHMNDTGAVLDKITHSFVSNHIPALERSKLLTELFGKSWLPLGRLFLDGETNFKHLTAMAKEFGLELGGNATDGIQKLKDTQEEYSLATAGLKVRFTELVAGPLSGVLSGFAKLTVFAKANQWGKFNQEVERIARQFETLAEKVLPRVAEGFAHIAPAVLKAFWRGFSHASLGAQALMAGVIATKFGLTGGIFRGIGAGLGRSVASGLAGQEAAAAASGTTLGGFFGKAFAAAAAGYLVYNFLKGDKSEPEPLSEAWHGLFGGYTKAETEQRNREAHERNRVEERQRHRVEGHAGTEKRAIRKAEHEGPLGKARLRGKMEAEQIGRQLEAHPSGAALGGTVMRSGLVEVGERGREIVHLPTNAQVTPLRPGSLRDDRPIIIKVGPKVLARLNRHELLEAQAAGA